MSKYKKWTMPEIEKLKRLYPEFSTAELTTEFNVTERCLYSKAHRMNLHKSKKYLSTIRFAAGNDLHLLSKKNSRIKTEEIELHHARIVKAGSTLVHRIL